MSDYRVEGLRAQAASEVSGLVAEFWPDADLDEVVKLTNALSAAWGIGRISGLEAGRVLHEQFMDAIR